MRLNTIFILTALRLAANDIGVPQPSAADIVNRMMERDHDLQAKLDGYTATRRYVLENEHRHKRAEMLVRMKCLQDGSKDFEIVSSDGWGIARNHVFPRLLAAEAEASQPESRDRSRIIPENYSFQLVGTDMVDGRPAYVIAVNPKTSNKYLMMGKIWVDAQEYAIVRIEGRPAKNPSFWTKSVRFVHTYAKQGSFWLPRLDNSVTDVRILGATDLKIEYFGYLANQAAGQQ